MWKPVKSIAIHILTCCLAAAAAVCVCCVCVVCCVLCVCVRACVRARVLFSRPVFLYRILIIGLSVFLSLSELFCWPVFLSWLVGILMAAGTKPYLLKYSSTVLCAVGENVQPLSVRRANPRICRANHEYSERGLGRNHDQLKSWHSYNPRICRANHEY